MSTALFACLYSAYETLATEKGRAAWWKRREREEAERKAAADHGGGEYCDYHVACGCAS